MSKRAKRCAVYTRKSSEEGLDQAFNSLDAQREACAAYISSQSGEGWQLVSAAYDDGGVSGGTMERPALQRLLADIERGQIDVVVVYKIDRLTRSLADFARMVELFDRHDVSFVSVTQQFNTTSSMGRLTLNVLLSFAQFEREVTGERIRDKIAASKAKGMWMGGVVPLGYDPPKDASRALAVNEAEAQTVRTIFATYLELGSVHALQHWLDKEGVTSKRRTTRTGKVVGGTPFGRGALFHLLRNPIYRGMITHKGKTHPGKHEPIVDEALSAAVQSQLDSQARRRADRRQENAGAPLTGRLFDEDGQPMSPTTAYGRHGKRYRYYVSAPLQQGRAIEEAAKAQRRVPALLLEDRLRTLVQSVTCGSSADPLVHLLRAEVHDHALQVTLPADQIDQTRASTDPHLTVAHDLANREALRLTVPARIQCSAGRSWIIGGGPPKARPDRALINALRSAHTMVSLERSGLPRLETSPVSPYHRRLVRLAFLAPELQRAILLGRQPPGLTLQYLMDHEIPADWDRQAKLFGAPAIP